MQKNKSLCNLHPRVPIFPWGNLTKINLWLWNPSVHSIKFTDKHVSRCRMKPLKEAFNLFPVETQCYCCILSAVLQEKGLTDQVCPLTVLISPGENPNLLYYIHRFYNVILCNVRLTHTHTHTQMWTQHAVAYFLSTSVVILSATIE